MNYIKKLYERVKVNIPYELKQDFKYEMIRSNFSKMAVMSIVIFIMEFMIFLIPSRLFDYSSVIFCFIIANIFLIPAIWYIKIKIKINAANIMFATIIQYLYVFAVMFLGVFLALKSQDKVDFIHMYLMAVMGIASFIYLPSWNRSAIFIFVYLAFVFLLPYYQQDSEVVFVIAVNSLVFNIVSWFLADMRIKSKLSSFINKIKLEKLAQSDSMTNFYNHEVILKKLSEQIEYVSNTGHSLSSIMIDIDNFKEINDKYGHTAGDNIIKNIADIIKQQTKKTDIIGRYGGDEFIIVLPDTNINEAKKLAKLLSEAVYKLTIPVTLSAGISLYSGETLNEFVKNIDMKLYKAKNLGRNRFEDT